MLAEATALGFCLSDVVPISDLCGTFSAESFRDAALHRYTNRYRRSTSPS